MALIELAESPLGCSRIVICIDRQIDVAEAQSLMKSLQWVGFELSTLDLWARQPDVASEKWVYMAMEV
jgi:ornithine decarboxylase antizyme